MPGVDYQIHPPAPVIRRPLRLSLKNMRNQQKSSQKTDLQDDVDTNNNEHSEQSSDSPDKDAKRQETQAPQQKDGSTLRRVNFTTISDAVPSDRSSNELHDSLPVTPAIPSPCITGLENLGNSCYTNSILQVLRFTPGFVTELVEIVKNISAVQKQYFQKDASEDKIPLTWKLAKQLHQLFINMARREEKCQDTDVLVTVKPWRLMETISEINPMFEGYLQHDAHELLCCIQTSIQDAHKELQKYVLEVKPTKYLLDSTKNDKNQSSLLNFFSVKKEPCAESGLTELEASSVECHSNSGTSEQEHKSTPTKSAYKYCMKRFSPKSKIYNALDVAEHISSPGKSKSQNMHNNNSSTARKLSLTKFSAERRPCQQIGLNNLNKSPSPGKQLKIEEVVEKIEELSNVKSSSRKRTLSDDSSGNPNRDSESKKCKVSIAIPTSKSQPSILSLFRKSNNVCRLGTSGVVVNRKNPEHKQNGVRHSSRQLAGQGEEPNQTSIVLNTGCRMSSTQTTKSTNNHVSELISRKSERMPKEKKMPDFVCEYESPTKLKTYSDIFQAGEPKVVLSKLEFPEDFVDTIIVKSENNPAKQQNGTLSNHELKQQALLNVKRACIKLEKCDSHAIRAPWLNLNMRSSPRKTIASPYKKKVNPDCIERTFEGMMALRTRCCECEHFTERREEFQDISVAVRREKILSAHENNGEADPCSWLLEGLSHIERLRDDNKYYCDRCYSYVEAERASLYETLPKVLTVHLKRFAAVSGVMGTFGLTKINDYVTIPLVLPCFSSKCDPPCTKEEHRYELYGIVMHSGISLSAGHYIAYVKVPSNVTSINQTAKDVRIVKSPDPTRKSERKRPASETSFTTQNGSPSNDVELSGSTIKSNGGITRPCLKDIIDQWIECDDDSLHVFTEQEFVQHALCTKSVAGTPYLLFYKSIGSM